jgi:hypothetical protein
MSGLPILDLVAGIIFIYFLLSIVCSSAIELWFAICKTRARLLEQWVTQIFNATALDSRGRPMQDADGQPVSLGNAIANHCMVTALSKPGKTTSYFNPEDFVSALLDKITIVPSTEDKVQLPPAALPDYISAIANSPVISGELKRTFLAFANEAVQSAAAIDKLPANITTAVTAGIKSDLDLFRQKLEDWFTRNSDRITGTLKRTKSMPATFIIGIIITIGLNADSVTISRYLYDHKDESKQFADMALNTIGSYKERVDNMGIAGADSTRQPATVKDLQDNVTKMAADINNFKSNLPAEFPIGWAEEMRKSGKGFFDTFTGSLFKHSIGWLFTVLAICLGAPFWFDVLNKVANLRGTGPKPAVDNDDSKKNS